MPRLALSVVLLIAATLAPARGAEVRIESAVVKLLDQAELAAQEPGLLTKMAVAEGERVERGQLVAQLDFRDAELAAQAATLELDLAKTEAANDIKVRFAQKAHAVAVAELARSEESIAKFSRSISQSQIDVERLTVEKLLLEIDQAAHDQSLLKLKVGVREAELAAAKLAASRRRTIAPIDAVVVEVRRSVGEWVEPGDVLARLVSTARVKVEGYVAADVATTLSADASAQVTLSSETTLRGKLIFVSPEIDPVNNEVRVWAEIANPDGLLRPGQTVELVVGE